MDDYSKDVRLDPAAEDFVVKLNAGQAIWVAVETDWGTKIVRIGVDLPTGGCKVGTYDPDEEDNEPNSEILELFA